MKHGLSAWLAVLARRCVMRAACALLGRQQSDWAQAMQAEASAIGNEREALAFACGCLRAALHHAFAAARGGLSPVHRAGLLCSAIAVLAGCAFRVGTGAPHHLAWMNLLSLALALATFYLLPRRRLQLDERLRAKGSFALGALLLVAAACQADTGAAAWWRLGPVPLNLSWMLLPALLVAADVPPRSAARAWALAGLAMAGGALALQADALLAGLVAVVLGVRAGQRRDAAFSVLAFASLILVAHLAPSWQAPQPAPFVDQVVQQGLAQNLVLGLGLAFAQVLPLWPALRHRQARVHGLVWGLLVALSLPGWLPSPLLGFGGSFIVGYLLSLGVMGSDTHERPAARTSHADAPGRPGPPAWPRSGLI
jgi:hypothetical protein